MSYNKLAELNNIESKIELKKLKEELATYDYIGIKISMGVATREEYAEQIAYTEKLRIRVREIEEGAND